MALVGHPADDLPPEAVMKFVLHAPPPAPGAVGAEKEHLARAGGTGHEQGHAAKVVAQGGMDGEDFRAGPAFFDGGGPEEAGQLFPKFVIAIFVGIEAGEPMAFAGAGQDHLRLVLQSDALRFGGIQHDGIQIGQRAVEESRFAAARPGHKDQPAALLLDQALDHGGVGFCQLILADADVAEENHVVRGQRFLGGGEGRDVVGAVARPDFGMEQEAVHVHAGIAGQGVAQVAVFPARERIHHQHLEFFLADGNMEGALVVFGNALLRFDRDFDGGR